MDKLIEKFMSVLIILIIIFSLFMAGTTYEERKICMSNGGSYSLNYGKCEIEGVRIEVEFIKSVFDRNKQVRVKRKP